MKNPRKRKFLGNKYFILANMLTNAGKNITRGKGKTVIEDKNVCL
jgi:hypothetical protein